jgi:hypothetical protein
MNVGTDIERRAARAQEREQRRPFLVIVFAAIKCPAVTRNTTIQSQPAAILHCTMGFAPAFSKREVSVMARRPRPLIAARDLRGQTSASAYSLLRAFFLLRIIRCSSCVLLELRLVTFNVELDNVDALLVIPNCVEVARWTTSPRKLRAWCQRPSPYLGGSKKTTAMPLCPARVAVLLAQFGRLVDHLSDQFSPPRSHHDCCAA